MPNTHGDWIPGKLPNPASGNNQCYYVPELAPGASSSELTENSFSTGSGNVVQSLVATVDAPYIKWLSSLPSGYADGSATTDENGNSIALMYAGTDQLGRTLYICRAYLTTWCNVGRSGASVGYTFGPNTDCYSSLCGGYTTPVGSYDYLAYVGRRPALLRHLPWGLPPPARRPPHHRRHR